MKGNSPCRDRRLETHGTPGLSIGAGAFYEGLPTLQASYNRTSNSYDILGTHTDGSGSSQVLSLSSSYMLKGFNWRALTRIRGSIRIFP